MEQRHSPLSTAARCLLLQKFAPQPTATSTTCELELLLKKLEEDFPELHVDSDKKEGWIVVSR